MNRIAARSLLAGMLLLVGSLGVSPSAPVAAECIGAWTAMPSFTAVARTAERIVVGTVVENLDLMPGEEGGVTSSFVLDVEEVLRGPDTTGPLTVDDQPTGARRSGKCDGIPWIWVREGDRVAIAFGGRLPGTERRGSAVAWIEGRPDVLAAPEAEVLSLARIQRIAGSGPAGHPVITPVVTCPAHPLVPLVPAPSPEAASASPAPSIAPVDADVPMASIAPAATPRPVGRWNGTWTRMPDAPIAPRMGAATDYAVGEDRIYVWGGRGADGELLADGAWFDVIEGRWHRLPDAGLVARERFGFDSDGHGLTI